MLCSNVHLKDERKRKVVYHQHADGDPEKVSKYDYRLYYSAQPAGLA